MSPKNAHLHNKWKQKHNQCEQHPFHGNFDTNPEQQIALDDEACNTTETDSEHWKASPDCEPGASLATSARTLTRDVNAEHAMLW